MRQRWVGEDLCFIDDLRIRYVSSNYEEAVTGADEMVVLKPKSYFDKYRSFVREDVRRIVEVGIFEGGSVVLLADAFPNAEIVGIDYRQPNPFVLEHIDRLGFADRVKVHYGVSQSDRAKIDALLGAAWGGERIDLVIDDASHEYDLTTATFDIIYPRVRHNGHYVIEDWGWLHWLGYDGSLLGGKGRALSSMVLELAMATAGQQPSVASLTVDGGMAVVTRGYAAPPPFKDMVRLNGGRKWLGL